MENANFDIFGSQSADINTHRKESKESVIYAPKAKDASDGIYDAKVRFLYNPADPVNGSIIKKVVYYLKDQEEKGHYFDSPQSVGDWNGCPIGQLWKQLNSSESALDRKNADELKKRNVFYSLVYIVEDKNNPSMNGKIKVFKYGVKLKAKLDKFLEPKSGPKIDVFNFYTGRNFNLYITRQGNFNNYDEADFDNVESQIPIQGLNGSEGDREFLQSFMDSAPNLEEYRYKPWTDAERAELDSILNLYRSPGGAVSAIASDKGSDATPEATIVEGDDVVSTPAAGMPVQPAEPVETSSGTKTEVNAANKDGGLDDFLNELGI